MTLLEQIQQQLNRLPPEKQSEVLDFVVFLQGRNARERKTTKASQRNALKTSLERLSASAVLAGIKDPVAWQKEIRQDRPLQGREA